MIPKNIKEISNFAFLNCKNLNKIKFLNNKIQIGKYAFSGCDSLTNVEVPDPSQFDFTPFVQYRISMNMQ